VLKAIGICKSYGSVRANVDISLDVRLGEIHAVLGENGAGKSTLMRILYGMEAPDSGSLALDGLALKLHSPRDAIRAGIGMVHQHFMLVPTLTVLENLVLGNEIAGNGVLRLNSARVQLKELAERYHLDVDLEQKVAALSVGEQQQVEILKVLVRGAKILILDEPTAVLMPQQVASFMITLRQLSARGFSVFIVTHKLHEAMDISDRVSVMRGGRLVGTWPTAETTADDLITRMIGRMVLEPPFARDRQAGPPRLTVRHLRVYDDRNHDVVKDVSLDARAGEILGIVGIEGNGQRELAEAMVGLRPNSRGNIWFDGSDLRGLATIEILRSGISLIPEDRHRDALVPGFSVGENAILVTHREPPFCERGVIKLAAVLAFADSLIEEFSISCPGATSDITTLSGGNQQKLILGREIARRPKLLIAMQPTRGLDIGAIEYIRARLIAERNAGMAILLISTELDEILALSDRVAVLRDGCIAGVLDRASATEDAIGRLMLGRRPEQDAT
jgi:general nucleoside transport system ATP-binding protein